MIKNMNGKMTTNSQLSTTEPKKKKKKTKQTPTTGTESTEMEITWRVISRAMGGGEKGKRYRE